MAWPYRLQVSISVFCCGEYQCGELIRWPDAWQHCAHCHIGVTGGGAGISYKHCKHHNNHLMTMWCEAMTMLLPWGQYPTAPADDDAVNQSSRCKMQIWWMWPLTMLGTIMGWCWPMDGVTIIYNALHNPQSVESKRDNTSAHWPLHYGYTGGHHQDSLEAFSSIHDTAGDFLDPNWVRYVFMSRVLLLENLTTCCYYLGCVWLRDGSARLFNGKSKVPKSPCLWVM